MRNGLLALVGVLAAILLMHSFELMWDLGVLVALILATLAIILLCRTWQRPPIEWTLIAIALVLPLAGWTEADQQWRTTTIVLYAIFGTIASIAAIAKRRPLLFIATAISLTIALSL